MYGTVSKKKYIYNLYFVRSEHTSTVVRKTHIDETCDENKNT